MTADSLDDWLDYIQTVHFRSIDMTLDRVRVVLERIVKRPSFKVVAVAGTNGKGSCASMLDAILRECGHSVGTYTSPHLVRFNERILVEGAEVDDRTLCEAFRSIEDCRAGVPLTYFEFATLAAVQVFQERGVDIAVMEVGMGGRLDAVNALPIDAALVTNVELDHVSWLGKDREAIGREKAHIMRADRPAVYGGLNPPRSVTAHAEAIGALLLLNGRDYGFESGDGGWTWTGPGGESWDLANPLIPGSVQIENAAAVLALLAGWRASKLDRGAADRGLQRAGIRARCEIVGREPMVMVDVAHNLAAIGILKAGLAANPVSGRTVAVFGMLRDKDPAGAVAAMDEQIDAWHLAGIEDGRGQGATELASAIDGLTRGPVFTHENAVAAYRSALDSVGVDDRVVVFGSFHIAGDILRHIESTT